MPDLIIYHIQGDFKMAILNMLVYKKVYTLFGKKYMMQLYYYCA